MIKQGRRVVVTFPHQGEALRTQRLLRKVEATVEDDIATLTPDPSLAFVVSPVRRGFVWRDLGIAVLPDTQVFRKRPPRVDTRLGRALQSFADLRVGDYVVHEDHGVGRLLGFETKDVAGVTRDYLFLAFKGEDRLYVPHEQIGKVSRYIGADAKAPVALEARREGLAEPQEPRASVGARARGRAARPLRAAPAGTRAGARPLERLARASRELVPVPGDGGSAAGDRSGEGGSRGGAADGQARLRRRRLRQDRGRRAGGVRGRAERPADARPLPDDRSSRSSTGTRSASGIATSPCASRWCRGSGAAPTRRASSRTSRRERSTCSSGRTASSRATSSRRTSASSCSTRNSASASPRRSSSARSGWRSTCSRSPQPRSRGPSTCRSRGCGTSRSSRRRPPAAAPCGRPWASTTRI